ERTLKHRAQLVYQIGSLRVLERVELGLEARGDRTVELVHQHFDALQRADRVGDKCGVRAVENRGAAELRIQQRGDLWKELAGAEELEGEDLRGDPAGGGKFER